VTTLRLLDLCRLVVRVALRRCPPPLPKGPGGARRAYSEESPPLIAPLRTLWRLSYEDMRAWLRAWPALALACGLPAGRDGRVPAVQAGGGRGTAVRDAPRPGRARGAARAADRGRDLLIDSAPVLAWRRRDPDAASGHAPANQHDGPFARPLLAWAVRLCGLRPRYIRLDAAYWGLALIHWIHAQGDCI